MDNETKQPTVSNPLEHVVMLRPMSEAPRDGTEILAYHESGGNFHPVKWNDRKGIPATAHWGMRWHDEYSQYDGNYVGWVNFPIAKAT